MQNCLKLGELLCLLLLGLLASCRADSADEIGRPETFVKFLGPGKAVGLLDEGASVLILAEGETIDTTDETRGYAHIRLIRADEFGNIIKSTTVIDSTDILPLGVRNRPDVGGYTVVADATDTAGNALLYVGYFDDNLDTSALNVINTGYQDFEGGDFIYDNAGRLVVVGTTKVQDNQNEILMFVIDNELNIVNEYTYGAERDEEVKMIQAPEDGSGFVILGSSSSKWSVTGDGNESAVLLRIDPFGRPMWIRSIGQSTGTESYAENFVLSDSGYIGLIAHTESNSGNTVEAMLIDPNDKLTQAALVYNEPDFGSAEALHFFERPSGYGALIGKTQTTETQEAYLYLMNDDFSIQSQRFLIGSVLSVAGSTMRSDGGYGFLCTVRPRVQNLICYIKTTPAGDL